MKIIIILFLSFSLLTGCKDYYNDMVEWCGSIPAGTSIDSVKILQPDYIVIDWDTPEYSDSFILYTITNIRGNRDIFQMENKLSFIGKKYLGRWAHK